MKQIRIIPFLFLSFVLCSQNLVLNPSFEDYERCPEIIGQFNRNVTYWSIPNLGSTDFFSSCSKAVAYNNYNGFQLPKKGKSYAGFYAFSQDNYREYVQGELSEALQKGKAYKLIFYISLAENSTDALKNIQIIFTEEYLGLTSVNYKEKNPSVTDKKRIFRNISQAHIKPEKYTANRYALHTIDSETFYNDRVNWIEVSFEFIAQGYEAHFSIGNFNSNKKSELQEILKNTKSNHRFSYYYIDDVSIQSLEKEDIVETIKINEVYIFKNVLFDFDKSELLEVSKEELNQLYQYLRENSNLKVEIYGHTDNEGLKSRNQELSEHRAKAVADYLILQGLNTSRIESLGFGSSQPVSTNDTEEGKQQNRRVTFKIID